MRSSQSLSQEIFRTSSYTKVHQVSCSQEPAIVLTLSQTNSI